jgi:hypothetical protein
MRQTIERSDLVIVGATRRALQRIPKSRLLEFVRDHPTAQVQDVADVLLLGLVLEANGPTRYGYDMVYRRLLRARKSLGLPAPRKHSVARRRTQQSRGSSAPPDR